MSRKAIPADVSWDAHVRLTSCGLAHLRSMGTTDRLEMYSIDCEDTASVIPRLTTIFWRLGVELRDLSTWKSLPGKPKQGVLIICNRPPRLEAEFLVKRMNNLVGVVKIRTIGLDSARHCRRGSAPRNEVAPDANAPLRSGSLCCAGPSGCRSVSDRPELVERCCCSSGGVGG